MFLDTGGFGPGGTPENQPSRQRRLTVKEEKALFWILGVNIILLLVAPIGGATLIEAVISLFRWM